MWARVRRAKAFVWEVGGAQGGLALFTMRAPVTSIILLDLALLLVLPIPVQSCSRAIRFFSFLAAGSSRVMGGKGRVDDARCKEREVCRRFMITTLFSSS